MQRKKKSIARRDSRHNLVLDFQLRWRQIWLSLGSARTLVVGGRGGPRMQTQDADRLPWPQDSVTNRPPGCSLSQQSLRNPMQTSIWTGPLGQLYCEEATSLPTKDNSASVFQHHLINCPDTFCTLNGPLWLDLETVNNHLSWLHW